MKSLQLLFAFIACWCASSAQVGIGTAAPNANAILDVSSATKAFIVPRLTPAAIAALTPVDGMIVFNTDSKIFTGYSSGGISVPKSQLLSSGGQPIFSGENVAQSFKVDNDIKLNGIIILITAIPGGSNVNLSAKLRSGSGYGGSVLATTSLSITAPNQYNCDFTAANLTLVGGQSYTIEVDNVSATGNVSLGFHPVNVYPDGLLYLNGTGYPNLDMYFLIRRTVTAGWKDLSD